MPKNYISWKSTWIYLKSLIKFWNLKIWFKSEKKMSRLNNYFKHGPLGVVHVSKFIMRLHQSAGPHLKYIFRQDTFELNFQISRLNLRFQINSNEFSRDRWCTWTFFHLSDILLTYLDTKILYLDITSMTTSPVQFGRELWFGWTPVLISVPLWNFKDGGC